MIVSSEPSICVDPPALLWVTPQSAPSSTVAQNHVPLESRSFLLMKSAPVQTRHPKPQLTKASACCSMKPVVEEQNTMSARPHDAAPSSTLPSQQPRGMFTVADATPSGPSSPPSFGVTVQVQT